MVFTQKKAKTKRMISPEIKRADCFSCNVNPSIYNGAYAFRNTQSENASPRHTLYINSMYTIIYTEVYSSPRFRRCSNILKLKAQQVSVYWGYYTGNSTNRCYKYVHGYRLNARTSNFGNLSWRHILSDVSDGSVETHALGTILRTG